MLNIALPKGRLGDQVLSLFSKIGYDCGGIYENDRRLVLELDIWDIRERTVNSETVYGEAEIRNLGDDIEDFFDGMVLSLPQYIASFYSNNDMKGVLDENKDIKHLNMSFDIIYQS